jgi:hypothetical protein
LPKAGAQESALERVLRLALEEMLEKSATEDTLEN